MTDIISLILSSNQKPDGMPAEMFFTDANPHGYATKAVFNEVIALADKKELVSLSTLLEHMNNKVPFDSIPSEDEDNAGSPCIWLKARLARSSQTLKLPVIGRLVDFIKDYQYGKVTPAFTLAELYNEATKSTDTSPKEEVQSDR